MPQPLLTVLTVAFRVIVLYNYFTSQLLLISKEKPHQKAQFDSYKATVKL